jgi:serine/threonine protein phosphatase 1
MPLAMVWSMLMVTFAIADIHGNLLGLNDALKKCKFKIKSDTLINLGDICDGGNKTHQVIDKLLTIKHHILTQGNHDVPWALNWMKTGKELPIWWNQGGMRTAESYNFDYKNVPKSHIKFLENTLPYYVDEKNRLFVHGGFDPDKPIDTQDVDYLTWDRKLLCEYAQTKHVEQYNHVFVGHTTTQFFNGSVVPMTFNNVTGLDTGGGWSGRITIMNVDTFEFWQSEISANMQNSMGLYQNIF